MDNVFEHDPEPDIAFQGAPGFIFEPITLSMRMHNIRLREDMMSEFQEALEDGNDVSHFLLH